MAQYSTKSFSSANQVNTLKTSCNSLGRDTGKKLKEIATDLEIVSSALEYVASRLHNDNMEKADRLYRDAWFKMSNTTLCKRLWSQTELTKWLNANTKTGKIKTFCEKLGTGCRILKEVKQGIDKIEPVVDICKAIYMIYSDDIYQITINSEKTDSCTAIRNDIRRSVRQFEAFMDIVKVINNFAPRGFKEYIDYNLAVFEEAKKMFDIADNYATVLSDLSKETVKLWDQAFNHESSWWNAMMSLERDMDANTYLDRLEHSRKQQERRRQYERDRSEIQRHR